MSWQDEQDIELLRSRESFFWSKVIIPDNPENCWLWKAGLNGNGYGAFGLGRAAGGRNRIISASRYVYLLRVGPIPEGILCLHTCDERKCCNPLHLFLGTHKDNTSDMMAKGRGSGFFTQGHPQYVNWEGREHSEESRRKMSESHKKAWERRFSGGT